jgi:hypothetical protein
MSKLTPTQRSHLPAQSSLLQPEGGGEKYLTLHRIFNLEEREVKPFQAQIARI